jgi:enoyl-CoA hydratase/carnithine racemase
LVARLPSFFLTQKEILKRGAGFVNAVVPPGHAVTEARKIAREICEVPIASGERIRSPKK